MSFVGSTPIAAYVYAQSAAHGKRVQCFGGAKNHAIIMPDANMEMAVDALIGAGYGSAGERCMAVSVAVPVGEETADRLMAVLRPRVENLRIGPYTFDAIDFGPVVTQAARDKIASLVDRGIAEGAELVVDGRGFKMQGYENGFAICRRLPVRSCEARRWTFIRPRFSGPSCRWCARGAMRKPWPSPRITNTAMGTAIFTRDGDTARDFASRVQVGMVGINVPVLVPLAYHSFGGWKRSAFGDLNQHGPDSIRFWTRTKTVTARWPSAASRPAPNSPCRSCRKTDGGKSPIASRNSRDA